MHKAFFISFKGNSVKDSSILGNNNNNKTEQSCDLLPHQWQFGPRPVSRTWWILTLCLSQGCTVEMIFLSCHINAFRICPFKAHFLSNDQAVEGQLPPTLCRTFVVSLITFPRDLVGWFHNQAEDIGYRICLMASHWQWIYTNLPNIFYSSGPDSDPVFGMKLSLRLPTMKWPFIPRTSLAYRSRGTTWPPLSPL